MRRDPYPVYCFKVQLAWPGASDHASMYFKSVSGLKYETEVTDYQEGGQNAFTYRLVGATKWPNLVFKRGFSQSHALINWRQSWIGGCGSRARGSVAQLNTALAEVAIWEFSDGWPCKWELSEFDASKSELSMETLEIAHHGLRFVAPKPPKQDPQVVPTYPAPYQSRRR